MSKTNQAKCIEANNKETKEVKIYLKDNEAKDLETIKDLFESLYSYEQFAIETNTLDEFMNTKVSLQLYDIEGQIVTGDMNLSVGWCGDRFVLVGNIKSVDFAK